MLLRVLLILQIRSQTKNNFDFFRRIQMESDCSKVRKEMPERFSDEE